MLVERDQIIEVITPYLTHIFDEFRSKGLWALSNIVADEAMYHHLLSNEQAMKKIKLLSEKEEKKTVRLQMYYFYLNILCVCKQDDFPHFFN